MTGPLAAEQEGPLDESTRAEITRAAALLRAGGLVALPTETVYGLGADARNLHAVQRIFAAKRRPADHPLIVHIADAAQLSDWCADVPASAALLAEAFWPGPLTLILRRDKRVLDAVTGGQDTIVLRVPAHPLALALLREFAGGVAAPSANRFGHVSPTTAAHVQAELGADVDMILNGGACSIGIESTIVDLTAAQPRILRPGGVSRAQIEAVLGVVLPDNPLARSDAPRVSGALPSHYAPTTPVRWIHSTKLSDALRTAALRGTVGVIALGIDRARSPAEQHATRVEWRALPADPAAYARELYAQLRELDDCALDIILLEVPPDTAAWEAVRDRLRRAAGLG